MQRTKERGRVALNEGIPRRAEANDGRPHPDRLEAGFDGYLSKPITPKTFVREVAAFLPPDLHAAPPLAHD